MRLNVGFIFSELGNGNGHHAELADRPRLCPSCRAGRADCAKQGHLMVRGNKCKGEPDSYLAWPSTGWLLAAWGTLVPIGTRLAGEVDVSS